MQIDLGKTYVVAVSGGVDSVVLLDQLAKQTSRLIVAYFDHGTRVDSADDAVFVGELAKKYNLPFETIREELGAGVSEEKARQRRYAFLRRITKKYTATLITAHHADDIVETIAINFIRGTGWRGLAVLDSPDIVRPLLHTHKTEILAYAKANKLLWHEDSTNQSDDYMRNRIRRQLAGFDHDTLWQLVTLRDYQVWLKEQIDAEVHILAKNAHQRHTFIMIDTEVACELLRAVIMQQTQRSPLTHQLKRALIAIKTAQPGTLHDVGGGVRLRFNTREFVVETV